MALSGAAWQMHPTHAGSWDNRPVTPSFAPGLIRSGAGTPDPRWRKSRYSIAMGECVEVGQGGAVIAVRDTADRDGAVLPFSAQAWRKFTGGLRAAG